MERLIYEVGVVISAVRAVIEEMEAGSQLVPMLLLIIGFLDVAEVEGGSVVELNKIDVLT